MSKQKPPRVIDQPLSESTQAYFDSKLTTFEFEVKESLAARNWHRVRFLFLDFGQFLERHPKALARSSQ